MNCCNRTPNADRGNQGYLGTGFRRNPNCIKEDVPAPYFSPTLRIVHRKKLQAKNIAPAVFINYSRNQCKPLSKQK